jgi:Holliday junction resolvasome RuvABC endonuclease subunit
MRILSIDPGSNYTGFAIIDVVPTPIILDAGTIYADKYVEPYVSEIHGDRLARIMAIGQQIDKILYHYHPTVVICESPYMGKFAASFGALSELCLMFKLTIFYYDPAMPMHMVDPATVKKAHGVPGNNGDKNLMLDALKKKNIDWGNIKIESMDEHSTDSILIGLYYIDQYLR